MTDGARPLLLVGNPRTGSTLLTTLLLQHPDIHMHGELFHPEENERRGAHALRGRDKAWFDPSRDDAIEFLDEHVFGVPTDYRGRPVQVVGLKVFADHVSSGGSANLFARLHARYPTAHVLHMRRDDYLSVLVSLEMAQRSRQWVVWSHLAEPRREVEPFTVPRDRARSFFEDMHRADAYFALHFAGPGYLPVHYEDLVDDLPGTMAAVFAALDVAPRDVSAVTERQVGAEDWALVTNLDELREEFEAFRADHQIRPRERTVPVSDPTPAEPAPPELEAAAAPQVDVPALALRGAARGFGPRAIVRQIAARGAEVTEGDVAAIIADARESMPDWLTRPLEPHYAAALLVVVPFSVTDGRAGEPDREEPQRHEAVLGAGILPEGGLQVLGVWPSLVDLDLGRRGVGRVDLLLADDEDTALQALDAGVDAEVIDTETLAAVRRSLTGVAQEDLRSHAADLAAELRASDRLAATPAVLRDVIVAPLHLRNLMSAYRGLAARRSPFPSVDAAVDALALLARSADPSGAGQTRWGPWRTRHTAALAARAAG